MDVLQSCMPTDRDLGMNIEICIEMQVAEEKPTPVIILPAQPGNVPYLPTIRCGYAPSA